MLKLETSKPGRRLIPSSFICSWPFFWPITIAGPIHHLAHLLAGTLPKYLTIRFAFSSESTNYFTSPPGSETLWSVWPHWKGTSQVRWGTKYNRIRQYTIDNASSELSDSNSCGGGHAKSQGNSHKNIGIDRFLIPWQFSYFLHSKHFTKQLPSFPQWYFGVGDTISTPVICISFPSSLGAPLLFLLIPMISSFVFMWNLIY